MRIWLKLVVAFVFGGCEAHAHCSSTRSSPDCRGSGYTYTSEVYTEAFTFDENFSVESECSKPPSLSPHKNILVQLFSQVELSAKRLSEDKKCKELNQYGEDYLTQSRLVKTSLQAANNQRGELYFSQIKNKQATDESVRTISSAEDNEGIHLRSQQLARLALFCGISDMSQKLQPVWNLSVGLRRAMNGTYPTTPEALKNCESQLNEINELVTRTFDTAEIVYKNQWRATVCTDKHHFHLKEEFQKDITMNSSIVLHGDCLGDNCEKINSLVELLSKTNKIQNKPQNQSARRTYYETAKIKTRTPAATEKQENDKSVFPNGYYDFINNKGWYCQTESNDLFSTISKRYCLSAYPVLLNRN